MNGPVPATIAGQVARAQAVIERHLGSALQGLYLYGSALEGGLKPLSDIDLLTVVDTPPDAATRQALMRALLTVSAPPGKDPRQRALELTVVARDAVVPWRHPARRELQFGEWLRADILAGVFEPAMVDPDLAILLTQVHRHSVALHGPAAARVLAAVPAADVRAALAQLVRLWAGPADWVGDERNVVLALCRIWYTAATGEIVPKDAAALWALDRLPAHHRPVARAARQAYLGQGPDLLAAQAAQVEGFVHALKDSIHDALSRTG
ncbi:aminoglycoside adenylyltransferase family protein [Stenotrophomonas mori]|uniref:Aminoglycoside (3'') (9) adenylyltransferase n=1 Tax=Stenotrophomonas mori TaxID=2871096 RepID=A0ABT0SKD2_9GAMM|nr:aminoglycoside adenylyltransferase family protein [Stenotrophomonas mori]MCL7715797.1 DUF4111 domain-containing protein [Stenotrophomonas mori]